jgi:hypothetical protein
MQNEQRFFARAAVESPVNRWDWALLPVVLATLVLLAYAAMGMSRPFHVGDPIALSLDPWQLPYYFLRTTLRMAVAMVASLLFAGIFAVLAAKNATAERVLVPLLDILQSIPILGFLSITVTGFIALFPGNLFGWNARPSSPSSPRRPGTWPSASTSRCAPCRPSCRRPPACSSSRAGSASGAWSCPSPCPACCGT